MPLAVGASWRCLRLTKGLRLREELASAATPDQIAVIDLFAEILAGHPGVNRAPVEKVSGLAVAYRPEPGSHPLAGDRARWRWRVPFTRAGRSRPVRPWLARDR